MHIGKLKIAFLLLLVVGSIYVVSTNGTNAKYITDEGAVFGTTYHITYSNDVSIRTEIEDCLARVDTSLSMFNECSVISTINNNKSFDTDSMLRQVFLLAHEVSEQTTGAFDVTVAPLVNAWGFGFRRGTGVTPAQIDSIRTFVGYDKVRLDERFRIVKKDPRVMLDCSAIAKGYGCDMVARLLDSKGVRNYMVEIGGELVVKGYNPKHEAWNIGITKPEEDSINAESAIQVVASLTDCAVATSGNYRRFYYKNGQRYAHTIDPRTGYPVEHTMLSSTVVAGDCATADAFATAFMVLGLDSAQTVLRSRPDLQALFIYSDSSGANKLWVSPDLKKKLHNQ